MSVDRPADCLYPGCNRSFPSEHGLSVHVARRHREPRPSEDSVTTVAQTEAMSDALRNERGSWSQEVRERIAAEAEPERPTVTYPEEHAVQAAEHGPVEGVLIESRITAAFLSLHSDVREVRGRVALDVQEQEVWDALKFLDGLTDAGALEVAVRAYLLDLRDDESIKLLLDARRRARRDREA